MHGNFHILKILLFALPVVAFSEAIPENAADSLSVMSFNIRYGLADDGPDSWDFRKDLVVEVIGRQDPDLIGLQEALQFQLDAVLAAFPEHAATGRERDGNGSGEYAAILYRRDRFDLLDGGNFWFSDTPEVPSMHWGNRYRRICTWARLKDRSTGKAFYFFNTHLDHESQNSREKSVQLLAVRIRERAHPDPVIVTGDFNAGESNPAIHFLKGKEGQIGANPCPLVDTFRVLHPTVMWAGTFNAFENVYDGDKIDYIFVTPDVETLEADILRDQRDGHTPSDHFPVVARIRLP